MAPAVAFNASTVQITSDGAWQGENPLKYAFPLLVVQTTLVLLLSRTLCLLLAPLRQPKVVAEIVVLERTSLADVNYWMNATNDTQLLTDSDRISLVTFTGGIVLGPSVLGRCKPYMDTVFPPWSSPILRTVSNVGLLFFLFLVGLELDINSIRRRGGLAFGIAAAGILLPFLSGVGVVFLLRRTIPSSGDASFGQFVVFIGVALSITAFPVLARILAELKLLTTALGETAMAAAAFNDMAAWVLLALAVALSSSGSGEHRTPLVSLWILLSGILFVVFMMTAVRPVMAWVARRSAPGSRASGEACIVLTLAGVLVSGLATDFIGIHSIFGAFVFGLTIPKEGRFAGKLFERIEDFVSGLLLPLYFASSGLKTDVGKISGAEAWGLLAVITATACAGKIVGTFAVAVSCKFPAREAAVLGVLMGTKGLVELIVLNIGKEKKVLNDETFTILVLMALFTTFITTPAVMAIYKPTAGVARTTRYSRRLQSDPPSSSPSSKGSTDLRILACLHSPMSAPSIINLVEMVRAGTKQRLKLYVMHLVELTERPSSIFTVLRARKDGWPARSPPRMGAEAGGEKDLAVASFQAYEKLGGVRIRPMTAISALATMHEDVCHVAGDKRAALVILPFHKRGGGGGEMEDEGQVWGGVNQRVLAHAPCSVGLLVDRGFAGSHTRACAVCVVFFGGSDDREALEIGTMIMDNPGIRLTVIRFIEEGGNEGAGHRERRLRIDEREEADEEAVAEFRRRNEGGRAKYEERRGGDEVECVLDIGRSGGYELVVVGRGRSSASAAVKEQLGDRWGEHAELGPIGNILASQGKGVVSSVLVVQQHSVMGHTLATATAAAAAAAAASSTSL